MATGYDKNKDYAAEISKAAAAGDYAAAARLEQQRNAKIAGQGLNYSPTNTYEKYLPPASSGNGGSSYIPLDNSGNDYASMVGMSDLHTAALNAAQQAWKDAKARGDQSAMDAAHQQAERIRAQYNYSGGGDGSQYLELGAGSENDDLMKRLLAMSNYSTPAYGGSKWDVTKDKLAEAYVADNYTDWTKSDAYAALADRYGHQGQLAMQDVLGQVASRTGGLANSYATTVAQQQYNDYMAMLEDVARKQYDNDHNDLYSKVSLAQGMSEGDYQRYLDRISQNNTDRSYALNIISQMMGYNTNQDETQYNRGQTAMTQAQNRIYDYIVNMGGKYTDLPADLITSSGYTTPELEAMQRQYQLAAASGGSGGRGSGGSGRGSSSSNGTGNTGTWDFIMANQIKDEAGGTALSDKSWNAIKDTYGVSDDDISQYGFTKADLGYTGLMSHLNLYNPEKGLTEAEEKLLGKSAK